jgi:hypothetical protein
VTLQYPEATRSASASSSALPPVLELHSECMTCCTCRKCLLADTELRLGGRPGSIYCLEHGAADKQQDSPDRLVKVCGALPPIILDA